MSLAVTMEQETHVFPDMSSQKANDFQLFNFSIEDAIWTWLCLKETKDRSYKNLPHGSSSTDSPGVVPVTAQYQSTDMGLKIIQVLLSFNP